MIGKPQHLIFAGIVDRLAAARLDDPLQRGRLVGILEPEQLRRAQDLAAVERRDLQPLEALVRSGLQQLVALAGGDEPEEVEHLDLARVLGHADLGEVVVDPLEQRARRPAAGGSPGAG